MKKISLGIIIGIASIFSLGMTYELTYGGIRENVVDVRVVEVGGHEYVIASSYIPTRSYQDPDYAKDVKNSKSVVNCISKNIITPTSSNLCMMHHVGCKACLNQGKN